MRRRLLLAFSSALFLTAPLAAQTPGVPREVMWRAPTEEEWNKPCLITWQRTWEDAQAVSRITGRPILVCVNMDGEIASEHYAGVRYRQPEIAKLYEPYVTVIASVYRHTPRDYDEQGRRVLCPRFGSVTCGEHIAIEPGLYGEFMDTQRVAPRHIGVELDGAEMYDVFYAFDTDSVFETIRKGIDDREIEPLPDVRGDRSILERVASLDVRDREAVEEAYRNGTKDDRRALLDAAVQLGERAPMELLRLAVYGFDVELASLARRGLVRATSEASIDLIAEALRVPMENEERDALIAALERLGTEFPRARTLATVQRGLGSRSEAVDLAGWDDSMRGRAGATPPTRPSLETQLEYRLVSARSPAAEASAYLELSEASLALAVDPENALALSANPRHSARFSKLLFEDARSSARKAVERGAEGWRVEAALSLAAWYLGDVEEALQRAEVAIDGLPPGTETWNAMAVLALFAEGRQRKIVAALDKQETWPPEWLTDVHAAYSVLARHPSGTDALVLKHYDFLVRLGARQRAADALDLGLRRFPESWALHDRLRSRVLAEKGVDGLEPVYEEMLLQLDAPVNLEWYAGYASIVTAEFQRRRGRVDDALAAYGRALGHYDRVIEANPESRASADHYAALALAGRGRLAFERGDDERAVTEIIASFERRPDAAASLDGLGLSPVATAQVLLVRLERAEKEELAQTLDAAIAALDPDMLLPAPFDRQGPAWIPPRRRR